MLAFFRRYHRFFYMIITVVVVVSFSFFGTYSALRDPSMVDPEVFRTIDGSVVRRSDFDRMVTFLGTDADDKVLLGGAWGLNFLNDGVIVQDFLKTGMAEQLLAGYRDLFTEDLQSRHEKEKRFVPYVHPQVGFISAETAWTYFVPDLKSHFDTLRATTDPLSDDALRARIALYLDQRKFPAISLSQVLRYQESQHDWIKKDRRLDTEDLSLFNYRTLEDWFGSRFVQLVAQFIFNASAVAESHGYQVSKEEALAALVAQNEKSYQQMVKLNRGGLGDLSEYYSEQLRRLGMSQDQAVRVWQKVMQFRRLFEDFSGSVLVDPMVYQQYSAYAGQSVEVELYRLPESLRFPDAASLFQFQVYLDAMAASTKSDDPLALPKDYKSVAQLQLEYPQLLEKRYLLQVVRADKQQLLSGIPVREVMGWSLEEKSWTRLVERFPELGAKKGDTPEARLAVINGLDNRLRSQVDGFVRRQIVDAHPEWIEAALDKAEPNTMPFHLYLQGGELALEGVKDRVQLMSLLDKAPVGGEQQGWIPYTGDQQRFYRFRVLDRDSQLRALTFAEAKEAGVLKPLVQQQLDRLYKRLKAEKPREFQRENGQWLDLAEAEPKLVDSYLSPLLAAIEKDNTSQGQVLTEGVLAKKDQLAARRFYRYVRQARGQVESLPQNYVAEPAPEDTPSHRLPPAASLKDQFKLTKAAHEVERSSGDELANEAVFGMKEGEWSHVRTPSNGNLLFFQMRAHQAGKNGVAIQALGGREIIAQEARRKLMADLLADFKHQKTISWDKLLRGSSAT